MMTRDEKIAEINKIYEAFRAEFTRKNYPQLFTAIDRYNQKLKFKKGHELGHFAILYTDVPEEPVKHVIVGDYPSWFDKNNFSNALQIVKNLEGGVPDYNSYQEDNHDFGCEIMQIFNDPDLKNYLSMSWTVGLNRFWIQQFKKLGENLHPLAKRQLSELERYCLNKTRKIIEIIDPEQVILFGKAAHKVISGSDFKFDYPKLAKMTSVKVISPANRKKKGIDNTIEDLKDKLPKCPT